MMQELGDIDQLENLLRGGHHARRAGRGRPRPGPPAAGRRVGPEPRPHVRAGPHARGGRPDREQGGSLRAHAAWHPPHRPERPARPVRQADQRPDGPPRARARRASGHEREYDTKPYEFGDPFNLHIERTVRNAIRRSGGGTPVQLTPDDFEVERTEHLVRVVARCSCSTCRCRCRCATTSCRPRRWPWRCTR